MKLYENHDSLRDRFEVLAFHDATAKTFEELDERLKLVIEKRWEGKPLPFPILLDSTGATVKAFGIRAYPTNILIDPEGRLVRGNAEKMLESKLEELAATSAHAATVFSDDLSGDTRHLNGTTPDVTTGGAAWVAAAPFDSDGTIAGDVESENGGEKPRPKQAAILKPKAGTKTATKAAVERKVKTAQEDAAIRQIKIELNLIFIKNGEKVRSGI